MSNKGTPKTHGLVDANRNRPKSKMSKRRNKALARTRREASRKSLLELQ